MKSDRIEYFRHKLQCLETALEESGKIEAAPNRDSPTEKTDDDHQPLNEMLQTIASSRNKNYAQTLKRVKDTLEVIKRYPEEFGLCEECEEPISEKRLDMITIRNFVYAVSRPEREANPLDAGAIWTDYNSTVTRLDEARGPSRERSRMSARFFLIKRTATNAQRFGDFRH